MRRSLAFIICLFCVLVVLISISISVKSGRESQAILESSIEAQLLSISVAAREMIDVPRFMEYNSLQDTQDDARAYAETLGHLRNLCAETGAEYIYALKEIEGGYYFVFDTDTEDEAVFIAYELEPVHQQAFAGSDAVGIMNVKDIYGSFNTGAVPIWFNGEVVGIICADIEDFYLITNISASERNLVILSVSLLLVLAVMVISMLILMRKLRGTQNRLHRLAHYDSLTDLPNRQSLMEYLEKISTIEAKPPFALLFIDLDNFKLVNDNAGHDAGDELLRKVSHYLNSGSHDIMSFRPSAGILNVAARVGGDEFVQVVPGVMNEQQAETIAKALLGGFLQSDFGRYIDKYKVGLSIGVSLYPYHSENYHALIKYADIAMYNAKHGGKGNYCIYSDELENKPEK
jgi:diguanylate cyclase (GGDEF)-like protein